jgi:hypothetical protein
VTYPDLPGEMDRRFPGWRTWNLPDSGKKTTGREKPSVDEQWKAFVRGELGESPGTMEPEA